MLNRAVAMGLTVAAIGFVSFGHSEPAQAQRQSAAQQGINGHNVTRANFDGGSFRKTGHGRWTEYNNNGAATHSFTETGRDEWSVYLNDRSRNVQLQIDIFRNWVTYGTNDGAKSDLYRITGASAGAAQPSAAVTNGRNVRQVFFDRGSFKKTGPRKWAEYNAQGRAVFNFTETGRDEWSVYLNDRSRNVQIQLDLHRQWISYGQNGGGRSDLYRISSASRQQMRSPVPRSSPRRPPRPASSKRDINAGPIWNQKDAETKCPVVAVSQGGEWTGQWRTTVPGRMSVCEIKF